MKPSCVWFPVSPRLLPLVLVDGEEEDHDVIGTKDPKQLSSLVKRMLAQ